MKNYALNKVVLGRFDNLQSTTLQHIAESDRRGVSRYNRNSLHTLRFVLFFGKFRYRVNTRHKFNIYRPVLFCSHSLVDAVACDIEFNTIYLVILRVLHDMTDACGFGLDFQIENNGIFRT